MAIWPINGETDWNTKMLAYLAEEHDTDGTHKAITTPSITATGNISTGGLLGFGSPTELTISSGAITAVKSYHSVDTEGEGATDNLVTINGGADGDILILRPESAARTVTVKDGTGNILLNGDFDMDNGADRLVLLYSGTNWVELSRSNNGS
jgi:hypothetical protein